LPTRELELDRGQTPQLSEELVRKYAGWALAPAREARRRYLRRLARRPQAALGWGIGVYLVAQLALLVFMERWQPELLHPEYGTRLAHLKEQLAADPGAPLVLVIGSSRTAVGFRPDLMPSRRLPDGQAACWFNFGTSNSGPIEELVILRRLLRAGIHPRWVFVEVLPKSYGGHGELYLDGYDKFDRTSWHDLPVLAGFSSNPWPLFRQWCLDRLALSFSNRFYILDHYLPGLLSEHLRLTNLWGPTDQHGWRQVSVVPATSEQLHYIIESHHRLVEPELAELAVGRVPDRATRELIEICRREGIGVSLLLMPETAEYRSWYSPATRAVIRDYLARLQHEYGVALIDASDWVGTEDFADSHHLRPSGAAVFSERFGREALRPMASSATAAGGL
jgi:hypothetical protein